MDGEYDYIIVGAGAAGCVLANRLSANPAHTVLLVEAGGPVLDPMVRVPKGLYFLLGGGKYAYSYRTLPAGPNQQVEHWVRGRILGGSTSINGMQYHRGDPWFWNEMERRGNPGWGWQDMTRVFRQIEDHEFGATESRGSGGPMRISVTRKKDPLTDMLLEAVVATGLTPVEDINEPGPDERVGFVPNMIRNGMRESSATAFLKPVRGRSNLTVLTRTPVGYINFDGTRARGVRLRHKGRIRDIEARKEVIVSAGGVESPLLLERSGVGDPEILGRHGVDVRVPSPNVGERVLEQRMSVYQGTISRDLGFNSRLGGFARQMLEGSKYLLSRTGIIATGAYELVAFHKSSPDAPTADLMSFINPFSLDITAQGMAVAPHPGFMIGGHLVHPTTQSSVHITSRDADEPPVIDARFLETDYDRAATPQLYEFARNVAGQGRLGEVLLEEELPGPAVTSAEDLIAAAWMTGHIFHATGATAMGNTADDVVDAELRVTGAESLRVVDAGVFPLQPGNTAGATIALAWRAADKILG